MVAAGARLVFDVSGVAGGWFPVTVDQARADIVSQLNAWFTVESFVLTPGGEPYELLEWPFAGALAVRPKSAYATVDDAGSVVAHAIYLATDHLPTVGPEGSQHDPRTEPGGGILDSLTALIDGVQKQANFMLILVAVVAVVLIVNVGGKHTRVGLSL